MREVVIISGKGGTGKTSLAASFAYLEGSNALVSDCDVDAANMHLLLDANFRSKEDFFSGDLAVIDEDICINCGKCDEVCRFDAIDVIDDQHRVDFISCEGCWYCSRVCPTEAISMVKQKAGDLFVSDIKNGSKMVHAKLGFAAENSGKLVAKVKQEAKILALKEDKAFVITDGSPGIGCPVISSLSGANLVVLVTEATVSGLHDLKRVHKLVKTFSYESVCIINKYDLNEEMSQKIEIFLEKEGIKLVAKLPYDDTFTKALALAQPIVEYSSDGELSTLVKESWEKIKTIIEENDK
ncbi:(4Fe-4S)-binding protein [Sulfurovum sp. bin170]|uniref:nucleotide-binding protein n=1 Tax=Sulfurovum sp. bin170 TaxID=2695268 RepID=UPI0013DF2491|nr:ATP-binding protein [Sulfurovum sp. bin170]NEW61208.1 (4Fe-4S)-binding protein [Sulfurovum sp. bin170]